MLQIFRPRLTTLLLSSAVFFNQADDASAQAIASLSLPGENAMPLDAEASRWLSVGERSGVQMLDAQRRQIAHWDRPAEFLDARPTAFGADQRTLFASVDTSQGQVLLYSVDATGNSLRQEFVSDVLPFPVEGLCLHRDPSQRLHLFLLSELFEAHQYLLLPEGSASWQMLPLRTLPVGPGTEFCTTIDAAEMLITNEAGSTLWRYSTDPEAEVERELVDAAAPFGLLAEGPLGLASAGNQLFVLTGDGPQLHQYAVQEGEIEALPSSMPLSGAGIESAESITIANFDGDSRLTLFDENLGRFTLWQGPSVGIPTAVNRLPEVAPIVETAPMPQFGDAADDPALWIHPEDPSRSLIIGTNKRQGLFVYDLQGHEVQRLDTGRLNNVDVRYGARWQGREVDIAVASNRDLNALAVFAIDRETATLTLIDNLPTRLDNIYGLCLYQATEGQIFTFANDEDGRFMQYALHTTDDDWSATEVRSFRVGSQPEGCVADDAHGRLYLGEEDVGIWTLGANPEDAAVPEPFASVGDVLHDDVEGLALYARDGHHYLIASSQGNNSYVVFDTESRGVLANFRVGMNLEVGTPIDGSSETDGLELISADLGGDYSAGLLIVQDGRNVLPQQPQNFKLIPWSAVQALFPAL